MSHEDTRRKRRRVVATKRDGILSDIYQNRTVMHRKRQARKMGEEDGSAATFYPGLATDNELHSTLYSESVEVNFEQVFSVQEDHHKVPEDCSRETLQFWVEKSQLIRDTKSHQSRSSLLSIKRLFISANASIRITRLWALLWWWDLALGSCETLYHISLLNSVLSMSPQRVRMGLPQHYCPSSGFSILAIEEPIYVLFIRGYSGAFLFFRKQCTKTFWRFFAEKLFKEVPRTFAWVILSKGVLSKPEAYNPINHQWSCDGRLHLIQINTIRGESKRAPNASPFNSLYIVQASTSVLDDSWVQMLSGRHIQCPKQTMGLTLVTEASKNRVEKSFSYGVQNRENGGTQKRRCHILIIKIKSIFFKQTSEFAIFDVRLKSTAAEASIGWISIDVPGNNEEQATRSSEARRLLSRAFANEKMVKYGGNENTEVIRSKHQT
ncbi:uncharacterized protein BDR25DRAFT_360870 [Lindgomyces ingoldianus]|uniref:Uncharacterized protein n=1 Tax=Lindgomyces ingoldianus TaxID=673940 RepID=A0ACB6QF47_9PLEO|nr:uncharacterized protein BDR25DRAFT_360870 [Lindgomyces ingoldianus]KAF2465233.1 hypothetical protein BDR25DRAFT_360870 [Lindgomyces ingoldianus]